MSGVYRGRWTCPACEAERWTLLKLPRDEGASEGSSPVCVRCTMRACERAAMPYPDMQLEETHLLDVEPGSVEDFGWGLWMWRKMGGEIGRYTISFLSALFMLGMVAFLLRFLLETWLFGWRLMG